MITVVVEPFVERRPMRSYTRVIITDSVPRGLETTAMVAVAISDIIGGLVGLAILVGFVGIAAYRYYNYRQMLGASATGSPVRCELCGTEDPEAGTCNSCGLDPDRLKEAGLDDHLDLLKSIGDVQSTLRRAHREAGGQFGQIINMLELLPGFNIKGIGASRPARERLRDSSQQHLRALRRLSDELDAHSELAGRIEDPSTGETVEEILMEPFEADGSLSTGIQARVAQASMPREIQRDINRIDRARNAITADARRRY